MRAKSFRSRLPVDPAGPDRTVRSLCRRRSGKVLVLLGISVPAIFGLIGLVFDIGLHSIDNQNLKQAADAASTAATLALQQGKSTAEATTMAQACIQSWNGLGDAAVTVNIPPTSGRHAGKANCLEVIATRDRNNSFSRVVGAGQQSRVQVRSVAAIETSTAGAAVVVLDPTPPVLNILGLPIGISPLPALTGGLEIEGLGRVDVDGAVLVNNTWGTRDENGDPAGTTTLLPCGVICTVLIPLTHFTARDIRVAGGVDTPSNYGSFVSGKPNPLRANRMPVPDPYKSLPAPTVTNDPTNVKATLKGGVTVLTLPLLGSTTLYPGVYDWIEVVSGNVTFKPGVYIIRKKNPITNISLSVVAGNITAKGVMFYITDNASYDATSGLPDANDGETAPTRAPILSLIPSVVIDGIAAFGSNFSGLNSPGSPFDGMWIYQRRQDPRPIVITHQGLLGAATLQGAIYAKWGHISLIGALSHYDISFVAGTVRFVTALGMTVSPSTLLAPAKDVYLVE